ncbi:hypothetical protein P154DRAFT_522353 [Amniculicola lignicola CBS 123094]|uniref:Uncharacterized protein n=1 Tax=Amniculicola lignicola CBS 123094 TaxID=1392246 RepID=A0A6A5WGK9_9PLEO|nr:hypothetical protein P154DRAFT_522353 [Amniculicola lignicola CBS 123094]
MVAKSTISRLLSLASLLGVGVKSAPTRTHCRCIIVDTTESTPSSSLLETSRSPDICANFGPELEYFRYADPELYQKIIGPSTEKPSTVGDPRPLTTEVLMRLSGKSSLDFRDQDGALPSAPTGRPSQKILCHSEAETFSAYQDSRVTLYALQVVVAMVILACIAECVSLLTDWFDTRQEHPSVVRLSGTERRLRARSAPEWISSVIEKRKQDPYLPRIDDVDEEDDDDECNRPVM